MPAEWVGVVYGIDDCLIHAIIIPDSDAELDDRAFVRDGELMMRVVRSAARLYSDHVALARDVGLLG